MLGVLMLRQTDTALIDDSGIDTVSELEALFTPSRIAVVGVESVQYLHLYDSKHLLDSEKEECKASGR